MRPGDQWAGRHDRCIPLQGVVGLESTDFVKQSRNGNLAVETVCSEMRYRGSVDWRGAISFRTQQMLLESFQSTWDPYLHCFSLDPRP